MLASIVLTLLAVQRGPWSTLDKLEAAVQQHSGVPLLVETDGLRPPARQPARQPARRPASRPLTLIRSPAAVQVFSESTGLFSEACLYLADHKAIVLADTAFASFNGDGMGNALWALGGKVGVECS